MNASKERRQINQASTYSQMILMGAGQGATLSPLTVAGISGVASEDAGAAAGLVNVAHQLGGSFGLGVLVVVFAAARSGAVDARAVLAHRVATSLIGGTAMLALALVLGGAARVRYGGPLSADVEAGISRLLTPC